ncbi:transposase [Acetobacter fallax]|uniref:Transposase n=1 Tax=Acetobacter fallax TaxID=1737473 RepID=A0ABX0K7J6_9PROT|nr:transposase [Acetobacter fallax]NHO32299.1 hypothetical protein [Acetobacter fallax]NHO35859.1 hypothetical protein [Acetobacter fallax]
MGVHAVVTLDGAGWAQDWRQAQPCQTRQYQPSAPALYSPELNPVENVWQLLRSNYLANRAFKTTENIVSACCDAWNTFVALHDRIRSIASRPWTQQVNMYSR